MRVRPILVASLTTGIALAGACSDGSAPARAAGATQGPSSTSAGPASGARSTSTTRSPNTAKPTAAGPAPRTEDGNGTAVTIAFGGDVNYDGALRNRLATDPDTMLDGVRPVLAAADLTVVNLETSIGSGGERQSKQFTFQAPPSAFDALRAAGVDVIGMANNHAVDFGTEGLRQTLAAIDSSGAPVVGIGADDAAAFRPRVVTVRGQRIAVIAATEVIDSNLVTAWTATATHPGVASAKRVDRLVSAVNDARSRADTVVVFLHWGTEKEHCPDADQRALAPTLVDAGADVIVGGHAHRVQGGGYLGHAFVEYGLGNFQFRADSAEGRETGVLTVTVAGRRVDGAVWSPAQVGADALPRLLSGTAARAAQDRWVDYRACAKLADEPTDRP